METLEQFEIKVNERLSQFKSEDNLFLYLKKINSIQNVSTRSACILYEQDIKEKNFFREYSELNDEEKQQKKNEETYFFVKPIIAKLKQKEKIKTHLKFQISHCFADKKEIEIKKSDYKILVDKLKIAIKPTVATLNFNVEKFYFDRVKNQIKLNSYLSQEEIILYLLNFVCEKNKGKETKEEVKISTYFCMINLGFEKNKGNLNTKNLEIQNIINGKYLSEKVLNILEEIVVEPKQKLSLSVKNKIKNDDTKDEQTKKSLFERIKIAEQKINEVNNG